jgi:hypothetical protein
VSAISTSSSLGLEFESDLGHFHYASWHTLSLSDTLVPAILTTNQSLYDLSESDFDRFILCYDIQHFFVGHICAGNINNQSSTSMQSTNVQSLNRQSSTVTLTDESKMRRRVKLSVIGREGEDQKQKSTKNRG